MTDLQDRVDYILSKVDDRDIYKRYIGEDISFNKNIKSPFREEDFPSLSFIQSNKTGMTLWRDWGDIAQSSPESVFSFVKKLFGLSFIEAIEQIENDFFINKGNELVPVIKLSSENKRKIVPHKKKEIELETRAFNLTDKIFWEEFGISIPTLIEFDVIGIARVYINKKLLKESKDSRPIYAYKMYENGETYYKIYDPKAIDKKYKWLFNGHQNTLLGFDQLPLSGDIVVLTKSLKDVMVLYEYGIPAFSMQSENVMLPKDLYHKLAKRFDNIVLFYDNDKPGRAFLGKISNAYQLQELFIPNRYKTKDISDFVQLYGKERGKKLIKRLMKNIELSK